MPNDIRIYSVKPFCVGAKRPMHVCAYMCPVSCRGWPVRIGCVCASISTRFAVVVAIVVDVGVVVAVVMVVVVVAVVVDVVLWCC